MRTFPSMLAVALLSLGGCVAGDYGYATTATGYAPGYAPNYAPAYGYGYAEPSYAPPPFFGDAFLFQFGGRRRHGGYDGGGYDGERGDGGRGDGGHWRGRH